MKRLVTILLIGALPVGLMAERTDELKGRFSLLPQRTGCASIFHTTAGYSAAAEHEAQRQAEGSKTEAYAEIRQSNPPARPSLNPARVAGELAIGTLLGAGVFVVAYMMAEDGSEEGLAILVLAAYPVATAAGVYVMGSLGNQTGSFGTALVGSVMGTGLVLALLLSSEYLSPYITAGIAPLMSTLAFNLTRRYKSPPQANSALVNVKDGKLALGVPALCILPTPYKPRSVDVSVPLLSLEVK